LRLVLYTTTTVRRYSVANLEDEFIDILDGEPERKLPKLFDEWLNSHTDKGEVFTIDLILIGWSLMTRLRTMLTVEQVHETMHMGMEIMEFRLQQGTALTDEDGNTINVLLAEERAELGQDGIDFSDMEAYLDEQAGA
jgi:hypothetical protein